MSQSRVLFHQRDSRIWQENFYIGRAWSPSFAIFLLLASVGFGSIAGGKYKYGANIISPDSQEENIMTVVRQKIKISQTFPSSTYAGNHKMADKKGYYSGRIGGCYFDRQDVLAFTDKHLEWPTQEKEIGIFSLI